MDGQDLSAYIFEANDHCYYAEMSHMTFIEAAENCKQLFGVSSHLAEPMNKTENDAMYHAWINNYFKNGHNGSPKVWIGITDIFTEGTFVYQSTNKSVGFEAWSKGNPDNFNDNEDCVDISWGLWNDSGCHQKFSSICQF